jgi:MoxR-like ATPase
MQHDNSVIVQIIGEIQKVIRGKELQIKLALAAFLARSHLLIDDLPGVGKTTLAKTLSHVLGLEYSRIQFTSDLLPTDVLGVNYFDAENTSFHFKKGAIFSQFLLADEINRATPKTQSALLEAMEEHQVSIDGKTMALPEPFFVIATKNPYEEVGTFELPSSQLDRFALSISIGYPDSVAERGILAAQEAPSYRDLRSFERESILELQRRCSSVHLSDALLDYLQEIVAFTRESGLYKSGLSTRGALALSRLSKAWALIGGRSYVIPDDVQLMLPYVVAHRLIPVGGKKTPTDIAKEILENVHPDR